MRISRKNSTRNNIQRKCKEKSEFLLIERKDGLFPEMCIWLDDSCYCSKPGDGRIAEHSDFLENYLYERGSEEIEKQISII